MANDYAYQLTQAPRGATDGSAQVHHDVFAVGREAGTTDPWLVIPNYHKTIVVPASQIETVMDMPDSTGPERAAKNQAYKAIMVLNWDTAAAPLHEPRPGGWLESDIDDYVTAYEAYVVAKTAADTAAATEAGRVDDYIVNVLSQTYPVEFQL